MVGKPFKSKATTTVCQGSHMLYSVVGRNFRLQPPMYITLKTRTISLNPKIKQWRTIRTWNPKKTQKIETRRGGSTFSKLIPTKTQKHKDGGKRIGTESFHNWQLFANRVTCLIQFRKVFQVASQIYITLKSKTIPWNQKNRQRRPVRTKIPKQFTKKPERIAKNWTFLKIKL